MGFLRLILAITVVIAHSQPLFGLSFTGGLVAVEVFFIISGFYMSMILDKKYTGKGSYTLFLSNRFLRLYPMFWVVLILTVAASIVSGVVFGEWFRLSLYVEYFDIMTIYTFLFQIFTNLALFGQDVVMFLGFDQETGEMYFTSDFKISSPMLHNFLFVPQAWTLGLEVVFYLIAPFLVRRGNLFVVSTIALSLLVRLTTHSLGYTDDPWTYRFFPSELALFLLGTLSYRLYSVCKIHEIRLFNFNLTILVLLLLSSVILLYEFIQDFYEVTFIINWVFYGFVCLSIPFVFHFSKSSRIDSRVGELSYPVYISHILVIGTITPFLSWVGWQEYQGEWSVFLTVLASYILVRLVSDPIEKIRLARAPQTHALPLRSLNAFSKG